MKISSFILLFCFSAYATSPLTAIYEKDGDLLEGKTADFSIYSVRYVLSRILAADPGGPDREQENLPADHCLIKKKRAVLPLKNFKKIFSLNIVGTVSHGSLFFTDFGPVQSARFISRKCPQLPPLPLYLGNPPPFA